MSRAPFRLAFHVAVAALAGASVGCGGLTTGAPTAGTGDAAPPSGGSSSGATSSSGSSGGTPIVDGGSSSSSGGAPACGTLMFVADTDAGPVDNVACDTCIAAQCAMESCQCHDDPNFPICNAYVECVYETVVPNLASSDAGISTALPAASAACAGDNPASSVAAGNTVLGCLIMLCPIECFGP